MEDRARSQARRMNIAFVMILAIFGVAMVIVGYRGLKAEDRLTVELAELARCRERLDQRQREAERAEQRADRSLEAARLRLFHHCERHCFSSGRLLGWVEVTADVPTDDPTYGRLSCVCRLPEGGR